MINLIKWLSFDKGTAVPYNGQELPNGRYIKCRVHSPQFNRNGVPCWLEQDGTIDTMMIHRGLRDNNGEIKSMLFESASLFGHNIHITSTEELSKLIVHLYAETEMDIVNSVRKINRENRNPNLAYDD